MRPRPSCSFAFRVSPDRRDLRTLNRDGLLLNLLQRIPNPPTITLTTGNIGFSNPPVLRA